MYKRLMMVGVVVVFGTLVALINYSFQNECELQFKECENICKPGNKACSVIQCNV